MSIFLSADDVQLVATLRQQMVELIERLDRVTHPSNGNGTYTAGTLHVNFRTSDVRYDGRAVELSALELKLLRYLIDHRGEVVTRDELLDQVWASTQRPSRELSTCASHRCGESSMRS